MGGPEDQSPLEYGFGNTARGKIIAEAVIALLRILFRAEFRPEQLEEPCRRLIGVFPTATQPMVREAVQEFANRSVVTGANPAEAAAALVELLDRCYTPDVDPRTMRPQFDRILGAYRGTGDIHDQLYNAVVRFADRVDGQSAADARKQLELRAVLRQEVEEAFLRSERASVLIQRAREQADSGRIEQDALNVHGVTWFEPSTGREVARDFVLDRTVGPKIERLIVQLKRRFTYMDLGVRAPVRVLMDGPPGTGKTMAARYIAYHLKKPCAVMRLDEIVGKLIGDTAKNVAAVLKAAVARRAVLFLDEVDGLFPPRDGDLTGSGGEEMRRITAAFLQQVILLPRRQIIICATNRPTALDAAFLRRFPDRISFSFPDTDTRREIVSRVWSRFNVEDDARQDLVRETEGTSGDHVTVVAMAAARIATDRILDDPDAMAEVQTATEARADVLVQEEHARAERERAEALAQAAAAAPPNGAPPETSAAPPPPATTGPAAGVDPAIDEAKAALEADQVRKREEDETALRKRALRRARKLVLRDKIVLSRREVEQAIKDTPPPPPDMGRDRFGRPMPAGPPESRIAIAKG